MKALRILAKNILDVSMYVTVRSMSHFSRFVIAYRTADTHIYIHSHNRAVANKCGVAGSTQ